MKDFFKRDLSPSQKKKKEREENSQKHQLSLSFLKTLFFCGETHGTP